MNLSYAYSENLTFVCSHGGVCVSVVQERLPVGENVCSAVAGLKTAASYFQFVWSDLCLLVRQFNATDMITDQRHSRPVDSRK